MPLKRASSLGRHWRLETPHHGIVPNIITYSALISALEKGKQSEQALEIFKEMQHHGIVPNITIDNASGSGDFQGAQCYHLQRLDQCLGEG